MNQRNILQNGLIGAVAIAFGTAQVVPGAREHGPIVRSAMAMVSGEATADSSGTNSMASSKVSAAIGALQGVVRPLSHPRALSDAFNSYFAYKAANPVQVKKPLLYFVDYGLPSTEPRGYVFDMDSLKVVDGPFMVAHGRGSASPRQAIPTRFSNVPNSYATSLGLYLAQETYTFRGKSGGRAYSSVGLRMQGESGRFNDAARARGIVAHGAPYVTANDAGRSEGCPAMELARANRLLPKIANGGVVFIFSPADEKWLAVDPWVNAAAP
jgi:hypothetical protein